jgi:EAL domain-containing protein (putative c-di-GMP-specific phosphodiesterase class I)
MNFMREAGCDVAQGYLIAPPMPAGEIPFWMRARRPPVSSPD